MGPGVQRTSFNKRPQSRSPRLSRATLGVLLAATFAITAQLAPSSPAVGIAAADGTAPPKAVFIVGPTNGMTDSNLVDAEKMAVQAETAGMDVRRVFFPHATWDNVLANIQNASLVVYMGHGYGWPSPYTSVMKESRQDGFGLNSFDGSSRSQYTYYGATPIKTNIKLAPSAVVILVHGCYTAGNGENGSIPSEDVARQRVDNFASGFLAAGAGAVFAFGWNQKLNYPNALMNSNQSVDQMFMTPADGSPSGYVGWNEKRYDSQRTPGATNHLDPHAKSGYYRAVSGQLGMTAADWRAGAAGVPYTPPPPTDPADPPQITSLVAGPSAPATFAANDGTPQFHPNGDGLEDELLVDSTVTKSAYLDAVVTNEASETVAAYSVWSTGTTRSRWNGKDSSGLPVPDGLYTVTYTPRDVSGVTGDPVSVQVLVLSAAALAVPTKSSLYSADGDKLNKTSTFKVTLNQPATVSWSIVNAAGETVRTVRSGAQMAAGITSFTWDGKSASGVHVPEGRYRSVVTAQTGLGSYTQERSIFVGAFQINPSVSSPVRGGKVTLNLTSTEPLSKNPTVRITQPGITPWTVTTKLVSGRKYKVTITLKTGADAGTVEFLVNGTDKNGGKQSSSLVLPLL
jgi:flagellar hook assembly protein FlgD